MEQRSKDEKAFKRERELHFPADEEMGTMSGMTRSERRVAKAYERPVSRGQQQSGAGWRPGAAVMRRWAGWVQPGPGATHQDGGIQPAVAASLPRGRLQRWQCDSQLERGELSRMRSGRRVARSPGLRLCSGIFRT